jgi:hypothetical protein
MRPNGFTVTAVQREPARHEASKVAVMVALLRRRDVAAAVVSLCYVALVPGVGSRAHSGDRSPAEVEIMIGDCHGRHVTDATSDGPAVADDLVERPPLICRS